MNPSPQQLEYLINHLFLPPKLPQREDSNELDGRNMLLSHVLDTATIFLQMLKNDGADQREQQCWRTVQRMLQFMYDVHRQEHISASVLQRVIRQMAPQDVLCLHISAQNAGVILRKKESVTTLEFFQASPTAASVTVNTGKLIVQFPSSPRLSFPNDPEFISPLCAYLADLDCHIMPDAMPVTKKAGSRQLEFREVADIRYISELLGGVAAALTRNADEVAKGTVYVTKRLNDHVLWDNAKLPWRRAPKWLVIRVALQTTLAEWGMSESYGYKIFITFVLARVLEQARQSGAKIPHHLVFTMLSKTATRIGKLQSVTDSQTSAFIYTTRQIKDTRSFLDCRWEKLQELARRPVPWAAPSPSEVERAQMFPLSRSGKYLSAVFNRSKTLQQKTDGFSSHAFEATLRRNDVRERGLSPPSPIPGDSAHSDFWFALLEHERWVANDLPDWLESESPSFCLETLREMMVQHDKIALLFRSTSPELFSRVFLTIMDLWVALDRTIVGLVPLLADYSPGLSSNSFSPLILPDLSQLQRLNQIEEYLKTRRTSATHSQYSLFTMAHHPSSFPARYFDQAEDLQALRSSIISKASAEKERALQSWKTTSEKYERLEQMISELSCSYDEGTDEDGFPVSSHSRSCRKCELRRSADALRVSVFEWPLPEDDTLSKVVVFELQLPEPFGLWRDVTYHLARHYSTSNHATEPFPTPILCECPALQYYFVSNHPSNQITIASTTKSFVKSHYRERSLPCGSEDIIKNHALHWSVYDRDRKEWLSSTFPDIEVRKYCTLELPRSPYNSLEWSLTSTLHAPNKVIASQSQCPIELSLHEWDAFGHVRAGVRLQWRNMILQLATATLNLADPVVHLLFRQAAWQAESPACPGHAFREAHMDFGDEAFGDGVLKVLHERLATISDNWQHGWTAATLSLVACRLSSLSSSPAIQERASFFLNNLRSTVWKWVCQVLGNRTADVESGLPDRLVLLAVVCRSTYACSTGPFSDAEAISIFVKCAIIIRTHTPTNHGRLSTPLRYLIERDTLLSNEMLEHLTNAIHHDAAGLDSAIQFMWNGFRRDSGEVWRTINDRWIACTTSMDGTMQARVVHVNLLEGTLLVDGQTLGHLPKDISDHPLFSTLFPNQTFVEASPSTMKGMEYQLRHNISDCEVHFCLVGPDLIVRTRNVQSNFISEFIPAEKLRGDIPNAVLSGVIHCFHESSQTLAFYPAQSIWDLRASPIGTMRFEVDPIAGEAMLSGAVADGVVVGVLSSDSDVLQRISEVFRPLERESSNLLVTWHPPSGASNSPGYYGQNCLRISLPRYKLEFFVGCKGELSSEDFPGLFVSPVQSAGTLFGLRNKLVLWSADEDEASKIIIPDGSIEPRVDNDGSPEVTIVPHESSSHVRSFLYDVDNMIGRLLGNGSLESWLLLAYLHIVSSYHLPDPLLHRTGVQQALDMLDSSHSFAFTQLTAEEQRLLQLISKLTPVRRYYPDHLTSMEKVSWNPSLSPLSQSDSFVALVENIFEYGKFLALFPSHAGGSPTDEFRYEGKDALRVRAHNRNSRYLPTRHSEDPIHDHLLSNAAISGKMTKVLDVAMLAEKWPRSLEGITENVWQQYQHWEEFSTPTNSSTLEDYATWLQDPPSEVWFALLLLCGREENRYGWMFALGILAYRSVDPEIIRALLVAATNAGLPQLQQAIGSLPRGREFDLGPGHMLVQADVRSLVDQTCVPYERSSESKLTKFSDETKSGLKLRRRNAYNTERERQCNLMSDIVFRMWPTSTITWPRNLPSCTLIDMPEFKRQAGYLFSSRFLNRQLFEQAEKLQAVFDFVRGAETMIHRPLLPSSPAVTVPSPRYAYTNLKSLMRRRESVLDCPMIVETTSESVDVNENREKSSLRLLLERLRMQRDDILTSRYIQDLDQCVNAFEALPQRPVSLGHCSDDDSELLDHPIQMTLRPRTAHEEILRDGGQWPSLGPECLLRQLSFEMRRDLPESWLASLVSYAEALVTQQRRRRISVLSRLGLEADHAREAQTHRSNWDAMSYPDWLLIQLDANILIRPEQAEIAAEMMFPTSRSNSVMQLNMGEGKSSVIVPIVSTALADGDQLVRVLVLKPLCAQMFQILKQKICGLANRRIFYLPFSRDIQLSVGTIARISSVVKACAKVGGILLSQPEHILSFQLMGTHSLCDAGDSKETHLLLDTQDWLNQNTRDILDESDEILSVKYQLIYTIGVPRPMEGQSERWQVLQDILSLLLLPPFRYPPPDGICLEQTEDGRFPRIRLRTKDCKQNLLECLAHQIVYEERMPSISFRTYPKDLQSLALLFLTRTDVPADSEQRLREYSGCFFNQLLHLRGLLAHGILLFCLGEKRWRVDYGLDLSRSQLAVPYRAKDSPAPRAEFGHPDVALTLTCLSYYYGGLSDDQLETAFRRLLSSDNPELRYEEWIKSSQATLPESLRHLRGLNLEDTVVRQSQIFPVLRYKKAVVDFYLSETVFPKEAREFPNKLTTNAWDIARQKKKLTTGFSGTNDNRYLLPLSIQQADSPAQRHTNAQVLEYLLSSENRTMICTESRNALGLVELVVKKDPHVMVLLDVGAQILELQNAEVAREWLRLDTRSTVRAAVYFDPKDDLPYVVSRDGRIEALAASLYRTQLDKTLVYLDEAHTRGTDFKFPVNTRAVVTLGPKLTKDKLVQGCMRMRKLGKGHSVLFFGSRDIWKRIQEATELSPDSDLDSSDVLLWTIRETCAQIKTNTALWASQGLNFDKRITAWEDHDAGRRSSSWLSEVLREKESRTLEELYGVKSDCRELEWGEGRSERVQAIRQRCQEFGLSSIRSGTLLEEQERELAREMEEERQVERAVGAEPLEHRTDKALKAFIQKGKMSHAFIFVEGCLEHTSALIPLGTFPSLRLRATKDFYNTVAIRGDPSGAMNGFLRNVQWILSSKRSDTCIMISPFEANELLPLVRESKTAYLHLYTPRVRRNMRSFDDLTFLTVPRARTPPLVGSALHELNLFAGQLFFRDRNAVDELCGILGLYLKTIPDEYKQHTDASGFVMGEEARLALGILSSAPRDDPVPFLRELIEWRRKGQSFALTHLGQILRGRDLDLV